MKIKGKRLVDKSNFCNLVKISDLNTKLATLTAKAELKAEQNKKVKHEAFDSSGFCCENHFEDDGRQNYLVFQLVNRFFKKVASSYHISKWKSKGLSNESIKFPVASISLAPASNFVSTK